MPESWITKCGSKLIYKLLPEKQIVYVLPIMSVLGRLPVVWAGDTGTIPFKYRTRCSNGVHQYDSTLTKADTSPGAELLKRMPDVLRELWGAGMVLLPMMINEA